MSAGNLSINAALKCPPDKKHFIAIEKFHCIISFRGAESRRGCSDSGSDSGSESDSDSGSDTKYKINKGRFALAFRPGRNRVAGPEIPVCQKVEIVTESSDNF